MFSLTYKCYSPPENPVSNPLLPGNKHLWSKEGETQGDPLAMIMFGLGMKPLIDSLDDKERRQVWYADDAAAAGNIKTCREWYDRLKEQIKTFKKTS